MSKVFTKRFWRRLAIRALPESIKGPWRQKLLGVVYDAGKEFDVQFGNHDGAVEVTLTTSAHEQAHFRILAGYEPVVEYQLIGNKDCAEEMACFMDMAKSSHILIDAGANMGLFSLLFCAYGRDNTAVAFEPSPAMVPVLQQHIILNGFDERIKLRPYAVGNKEEQLLFSVEKSGFVQVLSSPLSTGTMKVPITTIDIECEQLGIYPDLLKIDVEGCELQALQGAAKILKSRKPQVLLELHLNYLESLNIEPKSVCDFLENLDYQFYSCRGKRLASRQIYDSIKPVVRFMASQ